MTAAVGVQAVAGVTASPRKAGTLLAPLRVPAYRRVWLGRAVSLVGDAFQLVVLPALVLDLTQRPSGLGVVLAAQALPRALLLLLGGAVTDRYRPFAVLVWTNVAQALFTAALLLAAWTGGIALWHVYVYAVATGIASAMFLPASTSVVAEVLPASGVRAGNALGALTANLARFVVPPVAAALVAAAGRPLAFAVNAASFALAAVLFGAAGRAALVSALTSIEDGSARAGGTWRHVNEGIGWVVRDRALSRVMLLSTLFWAGFTAGVFVGVPSLAALTFGGDERSLGVLYAATGAGALLGAVAAGGRASVGRPGVVASLGVAWSGAMMVGAGLAPELWIAAAFLVAAGAGSSLCGVLFFSLAQSLAPPELRGRVMSVMNLGMYGLAPLAFVISGAAGDALGPRGVLTVAGVLVALAGAVALRSATLRDLAPDRADGVHGAAAGGAGVA